MTEEEIAAQNAAFAQMRIKAEAAEAQAETERKSREALEAKLTEIERAQMTEAERVKAELADAQKKAADADAFRDEVGRFKGKVQAECDALITALPQDKQDAIRELTQHVPLDDRLGAIRKAAQALNVATPVVGGTVTQPGFGGAPMPTPDPVKPFTVDELRKTSFKDAIAARGVSGQQNTASVLAALQAQIEELKAGRT